MRRWLLVILLGISLVTAGCGVGHRLRNPARPTPTAVNPSPLPTRVPGGTSVPPGVVPTRTSGVEAPTMSATGAPTPDLASMTFVERNDLFLQLLAARQAEGADTTAAEEAYARSLEAALEGNTALADQYLSQAIFLLWR